MYGFDTGLFMGAVIGFVFGKMLAFSYISCKSSSSTVKLTFQGWRVASLIGVLLTLSGLS